jgi:uncharacterized protein YbjQ (UPF0145 family)
MNRSSKDAEYHVRRKPGWVLVLAGLCLGLTGCSVHNIWSVRGNSAAHPLTSVHYPAHHRKVFLTESTLSEEVIRDTVARIDAGEATAQPTEAVLLRMAEQARAMGADAVINVRIWRQSCGFSWFAPQACGTAVVLSNTNALTGVNGYWY